MIHLRLTQPSTVVSLVDTPNCTAKSKWPQWKTQGTLEFTKNNPTKAKTQHYKLG